MTKQKLPREGSNRNGWRAIAAELRQKGVWREDAACSLCHKGHVQMSTARPRAGPGPIHKGPWEPSHAPLTVGISMHKWQEAGLRLMGSHSRGPVWNRLGTVVLDSAGEHPTLRGAHLPIICLVTASSSLGFVLGQQYMKNSHFPDSRRTGCYPEMTLTQSSKNNSVNLSSSRAGPTAICWLR